MTHAIHPQDEGTVIFILKDVDDLYPNYERDTLEILVQDISYQDSVEWRVRVWGADDCGYDRDGFKTREEAWAEKLALIENAEEQTGPRDLSDFLEGPNRAI